MFKKLVSVVISAAVVALPLGALPAQAAQIQPTTPTTIVHNNPSVLGVGADFELTAAVWPGSPTVTFNWQYKVEPCGTSGTFTFFSLTQNGTPIDGFTVSSATFTVPATIYVQAGDPFELVNGSPKPYDSPLSTDGIVFIGISGFSTVSDFGSSGAQAFQVGTGFCPAQGSNSPQQQPAAPPPYTGPVVSAPAGLSARPGASVVLDGSRLTGVSKAEIAGLDAQVSVLGDGQISIVIPSGLTSGTYDLVITSDSGRLTVQGAIVVRGSNVGEARPSTRRLSDSSVKVWVYGAYGVGKVQILLNGEEVAWVRTSDASDPKLRGGRLVRTLTLEPGTNVVEVLIDGKQVRRTVYTR